MTAVRPGIYKHYKGNLYRVMDVATHSETREMLVVYRPLYGERALWVRPLDMFLETVEVDGVTMPRFAWQSAAPAPTAAANAVTKATATAAPPVSTGATVTPLRRETVQSSRTETVTPLAPGEEPPPAETSVEQRVRMAMAKGDDRPDFSSLPVFENRNMALAVGGGVVAVLMLLFWIF